MRRGLRIAGRWGLRIAGLVLIFFGLTLIVAVISMVLSCCSRAGPNLHVYAVGFAIHAACMGVGTYCFVLAARMGRPAEPQPAS